MRRGVRLVRSLRPFGRVVDLAALGDDERQALGDGLDAGVIDAEEIDDGSLVLLGAPDRFPPFSKP